MLCGEAELPYALMGYATDYANGIAEEPTPIEDLIRRRLLSVLPAEYACPI